MVVFIFILWMNGKPLKRNSVHYHLQIKTLEPFRASLLQVQQPCELDKQGRILVPQTLREFAGLEKDVILAGNLSRVEVWSKEKWSENCNYDDMDSIAADMENMGIVI